MECHRVRADERRRGRISSQRASSAPCITRPPKLSAHGRRRRRTQYDARALLARSGMARRLDGHLVVAIDVVAAASAKIVPALARMISMTTRAVAAATTAVAAAEGWWEAWGEAVRQSTRRESVYSERCAPPRPISTARPAAAAAAAAAVTAECVRRALLAQSRREQGRPAPETTRRSAPETTRRLAPDTARLPVPETARCPAPETARRPAPRPPVEAPPRSPRRPSPAARAVAPYRAPPYRALEAARDRLRRGGWASNRDRTRRLWGMARRIGHRAPAGNAPRWPRRIGHRAPRWPRRQPRRRQHVPPRRASAWLSSLSSSSFSSSARRSTIRSARPSSTRSERDLERCVGHSPGRLLRI